MGYFLLILKNTSSHFPPSNRLPSNNRFSQIEMELRLFFKCFWCNTDQLPIYLLYPIPATPVPQFPHSIPRAGMNHHFKMWIKKYCGEKPRRQYRTLPNLLSSVGHWMYSYTRSNSLWEKFRNCPSDHYTSSKWGNTHNIKMGRKGWDAYSP